MPTITLRPNTTDSWNGAIAITGAAHFAAATSDDTDSSYATKGNGETARTAVVRLPYKDASQWKFSSVKARARIDGDGFHQESFAVGFVDGAGNTVASGFGSNNGDPGIHVPSTAELVSQAVDAKWQDVFSRGTVAVGLDHAIDFDQYIAHMYEFYVDITYAVTGGFGAIPVGF